MPNQQTVASQIAEAIAEYEELCAVADEHVRITYGQLGSFIEQLEPAIRETQVVGVFGAPSIAMAASSVACVVHGKPFVHLDPAMPQMVLHNIVSELAVTSIIECQPAASGQLPTDCRTVDAVALLDKVESAPSKPLVAASVKPDDSIYLVATSGTTGRPKCIPVAQDAAYLSYEWRDEFTPYHPSMRIGIYIFAIWEMFRPLRKGAELWFPDASTLMAPRGLADFLISNQIDEMLFTPSFYDTFLTSLDNNSAAALPLSRVVLNGEVVNDDLIAASLEKVPDAAIWNLYSICETHDVCMSHITSPAGVGPVSVGVPMEHLRAVILDDADAVCAAGVPGQLHFEGPRMLGPGYVNRPEETLLRFRTLTIEGNKTRLYDTGDQAWVDDDGSLHIIGRVAHMLKLRGFSIQTRELTDTMRDRLSFAQAAPWVAEVGERGQSLIFYFAADNVQAKNNENRWGLQYGTNRMPAEMASELRSVLPSYCVPAYLVQLEAIPLHPVSGKADLKALPEVVDDTASEIVSEDAVVSAAALAMGCSVDQVDPAVSFQDQGGDSLMCVNFMLSLEKSYGSTIDFELAMNVPLHRLDQLLTEEADAPVLTGDFDKPGILLTGATGFLGGHVLAKAASQLPEDHVVYCLVRHKRRGARDRLDEVARKHNVDADRYIMVPGTIDEAQFGLGDLPYNALSKSVNSVIHCAAMVNMAIGQEEMLDWSNRGIDTVLSFCNAADANLCFTSSSAVFPDRGGPWPEEQTQVWDDCTGYGAAKIAAEESIVASNVCAGIVRLPSLYDLHDPNERDIYEIILAASYRANAFPKGLQFPMIDVTAAAAFLLGDITDGNALIYNLMAPTSVIPESCEGLPLSDWLNAVELAPGIDRLIRDFPETLQADAKFENQAARSAWQNMSSAAFESISNPSDLLNRRQKLYQSEPALT